LWGNGDVQLHRCDVHVQRSIADFVTDDLVSRVLALDDNRRNIHVRDVFRPDGQPIDKAIIGHLDHFIGQDAAALDHNQRPLFTFERRGDQNFGDVSDLILRLISDKVYTVVVLAAPGDIFRAADPDEDAALHQPLHFISPIDHDPIAAALLRREGYGCLSIVIGCGLARAYELVFGFPFPPAAASFIFNELVDPLAAIYLDVERLIWRPVVVPVHSHYINHHLLAGPPDDLLRGQANVKLALMHNQRITAGDHRIIGAADSRLDGQLPAAHSLPRGCYQLARSQLVDVAGYFDEQFTPVVGAALAA